MRCWSVSVGAQEKRENVYSHRRNLRQANKLTMRIEGDEAETWIKRGAISKAAMATMPSKTRRVKKKCTKRKWTRQHYSTSSSSSSSIRKSAHRFTFEWISSARTKSSKWMFVCESSYSLYCNVWNSLALSLSCSASSSVGILFHCCCVLTPDDLICWRWNITESMMFKCVSSISLSSTTIFDFCRSWWPFENNKFNMDRQRDRVSCGECSRAEDVRKTELCRSQHTPIPI